MTEKHKRPAPRQVETTGHVWDDNLQELNNPLPRWWVWSFYACVLFAVLYWFVYPAWPVGKSWTKGLGTVSVTIDGKQQEHRWNTRAALLEDLQTGPGATRQREYLQRVAAADPEAIRGDAESLAFVRAVGAGLFGENCAACHGRGGQGVVGLFPNLADDDWLWGGEFEQIQDSIRRGRNGMMPAFGANLDAAQIADLAEYVLSLSGVVPTGDASARGEALFHGPAAGCFACHGADAKGIAALGSANLTDAIWTIANVPAAADADAARAAVAGVIERGVQGSRVMPGWEGRLSAEQIKLLSIYVQELGGAL